MLHFIQIAEDMKSSQFSNNPSYHVSGIIPMVRVCSSPEYSHAYNRVVKAPAFVKNSAQKKLTLEGLKRTIMNTNLPANNFSSSAPSGNETDDEDSCEINYQMTTMPAQAPIAAIFTPTNGYAGYSNIRIENHPRSASLIKTEPMVDIEVIIF